MRVAVIQGGPSTEAEVSRASAASVAAALKARKFEAERFELEPSLPAQLLEWKPDVVFPAVHGAQGEDGCLQGLLEILGLPYVGTDVRGSSIAADKLASKVFFRTAGVPLAGERKLSPGDLAGDPAQLLQDLRADLGPNLVIKPVQGGSTIGISRVFESATPADFQSALSQALSRDALAMAETYLAGKELTCAVLDEDEGPRALPVVYIETQATEWYDFESKYAPGGSRHECPAPISEEAAAQVQDAAVRAHRAVGARDLSRSDFILTESGPVLLEINTLPGMTDVSLFPDAARAAGMSFEDLIEHLVRRAVGRGATKGQSGQALPGR